MINQFIQTDMTNGMEDMSYKRNMTYYEGYWYWGETDDDTLYVYKAPDFTTGKSLVRSVTLIFSGSPTITATTSNIMTKVLGGVIVCAATVKYYDSDDSRYYFGLVVSDGGTRRDQYASVLTDVTADNYYIIDMTYDGANRYLMYSFNNNVTGLYMYMWNMSGASGNILTGYLNEQSVWAGNYYEGKYWFVMQKSDNSFHIYTYNFTGWTDQETITANTPATYDVNEQFYGIYSRSEVLIDGEQFLLRLLDNNWNSISETTSNVCIIEDVDRLKYIIWDDSIYIWTNGGTIERLQEYTGSVIGGFKDWFTDGTNAYQLGESTTDRFVRGTIKREIGKADSASGLMSITAPIKNQFAQIMYNDEIAYQGRIDRDRNDGFLYEWVMKHGVTEDLAVKIKESYSAQTIPEMLTDIVDNYCNNVWYGKTESNNDWDDWTLTAGSYCSNTEYEERVFINSDTSNLDTYHNLLYMSDGSGAYQCKATQSKEYTIFSTWLMLPTIGSFGAEFYHIYIKDGATTVADLSIKDTGVMEIEGTTVTTLTEDYMYHVAVVIDPAGTVDVWVNGVLEQDDIACTAGDPDSISIETVNGANPARLWLCDCYLGDDLDDAMYTFSSISPILTTTYDKDVDTSLKKFIKWAQAATGKVIFFSPEYQIFFGDFKDSGEDLTMDGGSDYGMRERKYEEFQEKYSRITIYGGYKDGEQLSAETVNDTNNGYWQDTFPLVKDQTELDNLLTQITADKSVDIVAADLYMNGKPLVVPGTSFSFTNTKRGLSAETFNCIRVGLDLSRMEQGFYSTDSYWIPDYNRPDQTTDERVDHVEDKVEDNEQHIAELEANVEIVSNEGLLTDGSSVMDNDAAIQWRNAADTGDLEGIKINTSNELQLYNKVRISGATPYLYFTDTDSSRTSWIHQSVADANEPFTFGTNNSFSFEVDSVVAIGINTAGGLTFAVGMADDLDMNTHKITALTDGSASTDACAYGQLTSHTGASNPHSGSASTTDLADYLPLAGGSMSGDITMNGNTIQSGGDINVTAGNEIRTYDTTNAKYLQMEHDDTDGVLTVSSGNLKIPSNLVVESSILKGSALGFYINGTNSFTIGETVVDANVDLDMNDNDIDNVGDIVMSTGYSPSADLQVATKEYVDDVNNAFNAIGSANAQWQVCTPDNIGGYVPATPRSAGYYGWTQSLGSSPFWVTYTLPLPTNKGGLKLYIAESSISLLVSSSSLNYIDARDLRGHSYAAGTNGTLLDQNTNNVTTISDASDTFGTDYDVSSYDYVTFSALCRSTASAALKVGHARLKYYYGS